MKLTDIYESIKPERDMFEGFNETELSEEYPTGFSFDEFKKIRSYRGKMNYARQYLGKPLGTGSSRVVYRVDNDKVLKLAKNEKGIHQNEAETNFYGDAYYEDIIAKVIDFDDQDGYWTEMELAFRAKHDDFKRLWGIKFKDLYFYLERRYQENNGRQPTWSIDEKIKEELDNSDDVMHLVSFMFDSTTLPSDLCKMNSWGIVKREYGDALVLIDFGFTDEVYESYYK
jgi:hypothetical protein